MPPGALLTLNDRTPIHGHDPDRIAGQLAEAEEEQLLKLWQGLGYYNRVRNLQKAARQILQNPSAGNSAEEVSVDPSVTGSTSAIGFASAGFPRTMPEILALPGIGEYTTGAIDREILQRGIDMIK